MAVTINGTNGVTFNNGSTQDVGGVGIGQTWTDVTGSRGNGVTYTNSTGKPIAIALSAWASTSNGNFYVNGVLVYGGLGRSTYFNTLPVFMIVPNGANYSTSGFDYIGSWLELR
jgi:hypothetical protein